IALTVYTVIDCVRAERWERRGLPLWLWILVIVVLPVLGALTWLISRWTTPQPGPGGRPATRPGPTAPDDDPDFLAGLNRSGGPTHGSSGSPRTSPRRPSGSGPAQHGPADTPPGHEDDGHDSPDEGPGRSPRDEDPHRHGEDRRGRPGSNS